MDYYKICTDQEVDLGLSVKWAGWNVGASSPEENGGLYGWADITGKKTSKNTDDYTGMSLPISICGDEAHDVARATWGGTWRLPNLFEINELMTYCKWIWSTYNGKRGYCIQGPNGNSIFLPTAGFREGTKLGHQGSQGYYWIGEVRGDHQPHHLTFGSESKVVYCDGHLYLGYAVRAVK